jgi:hypothetical protein
VTQIEEKGENYKNLSGQMPFNRLINLEICAGLEVYPAVLVCYKILKMAPFVNTVSGEKLEFCFWLRKLVPNRDFVCNNYLMNSSRFDCLSCKQTVSIGFEGYDHKTILNFETNYDDKTLQNDYKIEIGNFDQ